MSGSCRETFTRRRWGVLLLAGVFGLLSSPASGQEEYQISWEIGIGGLYKEGHWTYARVTLSNPGDEPMDLVARVGAMAGGRPITSSVPFTLGPKTGKKTRFIYFPAPDTMDSVALIVGRKGRRGVVQADPPPVPGRASVILGIASRKPSSTVLRIQTVLRETGLTQAKATYIPLTDLPDRRIGLDALHTLVLPEGGVGLAPAQAEAITRWVAAGGELILGGGGTVNEMGASPLVDLFPILPEGSLDREAPIELAQVMGGSPDATPLGEMTLTWGRLRTGEVLLQSEEVPLVMRRPYGQGRCTFLAFNPDALRTHEDEGIWELWDWLLEVDPEEAKALSITYAPATQEIEACVGNFSQTQPIRLGWIIILVGAYVLAIGPVNYLVLKRLKRLEWTWIAFTVAVVAFSGIAYFGSTWARGKSISTREVSLVDVDPVSGWQTRSTFLGVHSPRNIALNFQGVSRDTSLSSLIVAEEYSGMGFPGSAPPKRKEAAALRSGEVDTLASQVRIWTPASFQFQTTDRGAPTTGIASLQGEQLTLVLQNPFSEPLTEVVAVSREGIFELGDLPAGAEREWSGISSRRSLDGWIDSRGLHVVRQLWGVGPGMPRMMGYRPTVPSRTPSVLALYLSFAKDLEEWPTLGEGFPMRPTVEVRGINRREWIDKGGLLVFGWLDSAPETYIRAGWSPSAEEKVCLVRFAIWPD